MMSACSRHKLVSNTNIDKFVNPLDGFWMDIEQQAVGSSKTATVEIISAARRLTMTRSACSSNTRARHRSPVASFATTLPATVLTTAGAVTTSTATWNSSPATPVKQKLEVTFTPQTRRPGAGPGAARQGIGDGLRQSRDHDHLMASNTLSASRAGVGSVVLTTTPASSVLASQIVGVGVVGGTTTVTAAPTPRQYAVTVIT